MLLFVNANGIKTLLTNDLSKFPVKSNPEFSNDPEILPNRVFDNFIVA